MALVTNTMTYTVYDSQGVGIPNARLIARLNSVQTETEGQIMSTNITAVADSVGVVTVELPSNTSGHTFNIQVYESDGIKRLNTFDVFITAGGQLVDSIVKSYKPPHDPVLAG